MTKEPTGKSAASLAVFVLLGIFALMSVMVVLMFSQEYRMTINAVHENGESRIVESFLADLTRACDKADSVSVNERDGVTMVCLRQEDGWTRCVYCADGNLCEQMTDDVETIDFSFGEVICSLKAFDASLSGRMLQMNATRQNGLTLEVHASLMCAQKEGMP